jgi:hypothetical protein
MDTNTIESAFASIDRARKIEFEAKSQLLTRELFHWFGVAPPVTRGSPSRSADSRSSG